MNERKLARGLGYFSLALGVAELAMPRKISRSLGLRKERNGLLRAFGAREVAAGAGLFARNPLPWVWARVAGDALDLATLGAGFRKSRRRVALGAATAAVAAVTAIDVICGLRLKESAA